MASFSTYKLILDNMEKYMRSMVIAPNRSANLTTRESAIEGSEFRFQEVIRGVTEPAEKPAINLVIPGTQAQYQHIGIRADHDIVIKFVVWMETTQEYEMEQKMRVYCAIVDKFSDFIKQTLGGAVLLTTALSVDYMLNGYNGINKFEIIFSALKSRIQ